MFLIDTTLDMKDENDANFYVFSISKIPVRL